MFLTRRKRNRKTRRIEHTQLTGAQARVMSLLNAYHTGTNSSIPFLGNTLGDALFPVHPESAYQAEEFVGPRGIGLAQV